VEIEVEDQSESVFLVEALGLEHRHFVGYGGSSSDPVEANGQNELVLPIIGEVDYSDYIRRNVSTLRIGGSASEDGTRT
jgi:hypothetical protein